MSACAAATHNSVVCMFLIGMQWTFHCFLVQIDSVVVFGWALAPFCVWCFPVFVSLSPLAKRKSGWGICGSSLWCGCWFFVLLQSIC